MGCSPFPPPLSRRFPPHWGWLLHPQQNQSVLLSLSTLTLSGGGGVACLWTWTVRDSRIDDTGMSDCEATMSWNLTGQTLGRDVSFIIIVCVCVRTTKN